MGVGMHDGAHAVQTPSANETSPLISRNTTGPGAREAIVAQNYHAIDDSYGKVPDVEENALSRQTSHDSADEHQRLSEGLPEVKKNLKYIFPALAIGIFLSAADQTIIVSSYGKIGSELHALNQTSWIATAYFLTLTSFQPLYGRLSEIFGRKSCLLFGYTIFGLGCLGCGLAQDIVQLIAARAFAGIGGGAMTTVISILFSDICTLRERGQWQGYINIIYAVGASAGAPLGGIAADSVGWRWAFLLQVPMCALAFVAVAVTLHLPKPRDEEGTSSSLAWRKKLRRIDFLGATVLIGAVFSLLLGFDRGSNESWASPTALISLALSVLLWISFVYIEMKIAFEPFAPGHIIFNPTMIACFACNFFSMAGWLAATFYIPLYFQTVFHLSATGAGIRLIPSVLMSVCGSLFAGYYMRETGKYYRLTIAAYIALFVGMLGIFVASGPMGASGASIILAMCIAGFANGCGITTTLIALIANASPEDQAVATACSYLFRTLGSTFGVSMSATVANSALRRALSTHLPALGMPEEQAVEIAERVRESLAYLKNLDPQIRAVVERCFARSTNAAFGLQIVFIVGATISAWFIREKALSR